MGVMFWIHSSKNSFFEVSRKQQHETIEKLISQGTVHSGYYIYLVLATFIVTPGLFLNNIPVVIGGMILAPLMIPLLSLSLSLVSGSVHGMLRSFKILVYSIILAVLTSAIVTFSLAQTYGNIVWLPEEIQPGIYLFIAFCSGIAAAFAWVKEDLAPTIAGVATAVSLLPPLCIAGVGLAMQDYIQVQNSLIIFVANLLGIIIAAFLVFWVLGFLQTGELEEKIIEKVEED